MNDLSLNAEVDVIREASESGTSNPMPQNLVSEWASGDTIVRRTDFVQELGAESRALLLIPGKSRSDIEFGALLGGDAIQVHLD
jgi:hypothetical protein